MGYLVQLSGYHILKNRDAPCRCLDAVENSLTAGNSRQVQQVVTIPHQFCFGTNVGSDNRH